MSETTITLTREDRDVLFGLLCVCYWQDLCAVRTVPAAMRERVRYDLDTDEQGTKCLTFADTLTAEELLGYIQRIEQLPPEILASSILERLRQDIIQRIPRLVRQAEARDKRGLASRPGDHSRPDATTAVSSPPR